MIIGYSKGPTMKLYTLNQVERAAFGWPYIFVQLLPTEWARKKAHLLHWRITHRRLRLPKRNLT